jgi:hypothetical protein
MLPKSTRISTTTNILCLGVSYAQLGNYTKTNTNTIDSVIDAVRCGKLTEMDGRDLARLIQTELECGVDAYTVSLEEAATQYRADRHLYANFNRHGFVSSVQRAFAQVKFQQVLLDYFWIPSSWNANHWTRSFFKVTLAQMKGLLVSSQGRIYLPFCLHCFKEVLACRKTLLQTYNISFLYKHQLGEIALWRGTQTIAEQTMQFTLGKRRDQEELYCRFGPSAVMGQENDPSITKTEILHYCRKLEDFEDIRFIVLEPIAEDTIEDGARGRVKKTMKGKILGLVRSSRVKRGFDQVGVTDAPTVRLERTFLPKSPICRTRLHRATKAATPTRKQPISATQTRLTARSRKMLTPKRLLFKTATPSKRAKRVSARSCSNTSGTTTKQKVSSTLSTKKTGAHLKLKIVSPTPEATAKQSPSKARAQAKHRYPIRASPSRGTVAATKPNVSSPFSTKKVGAYRKRKIVSPSPEAAKQSPLKVRAQVKHRYPIRSSPSQRAVVAQCTSQYERYRKKLIPRNLFSEKALVGGPLSLIK